MLQVEFQQALKRSKCSKTCLLCARIQADFDTAYEIACRFYSSDTLDNVPGINGPNRHDVFVEWLHSNFEKYTRAIIAVENAMLDAKKKALAELGL